MVEKTKARIMDATRIRRVLARVATEIIERNRKLKSLVIVAVKPRGLAIGQRIARFIKDLEGVDVPVGLLDITPYRDDMAGPAAAIRSRRCRARLLRGQEGRPPRR